jgi:hypothetical protein
VCYFFVHSIKNTFIMLKINFYEGNNKINKKIWNCMTIKYENIKFFLLICKLTLFQRVTFRFFESKKMNKKFVYSTLWYQFSVTCKSVFVKKLKKIYISEFEEAFRVKKIWNFLIEIKKKHLCDNIWFCTRFEQLNFPN